MAESYSVEAFLRADHTGFVRGFQVAAQAARDFQRNVNSMDTSGIENAGRQFEQVGGRIQGVGRGMAKTGGLLTAGVTLPLVALGKAAATTGMDFEAQMDRVGAIAGATAGEMDLLTSSALDLGASTSKSASEVAIAQEGLAAMGFTVTDILGAMPGVISAAEASGADMAQTADVMAAALNIFGLEATEASRVADVLAQTANVSAADITDMQYALKYAGPPAAALGVSLEELSASIGIMTNAGLGGENAGTALRAALLSMLNPSEKNAKAMEALGISMTDAEGNFIGISGVVESLSTALDGQTDAQKTATLAQLVGTEAVSGMLALMSAGPGEIDKMTASLENSGGASEKTAAIMKDNLKGTLDELGGTFETAAITIGNILSPAISAAAGFIQSLVEKFQNASPAMQTFSVVLAAVAAAMGPIITFFGLLVTAVGMVVSNFGILLQRFAPIIARHTALKTAVGLLGRAFGLILGPIGIAITVLLSLIPVFVKLYQKSETFRSIVDTVWNAILTTIQTVVQAVVSFVMSVWGELVAYWNENGQMIMEATSNVWNVISTVISAAMTVISAIFSVVWPAIQIIIMSVWENIKGVISGALNIIMGLVTIFSGLFTGNWTAMWEGVKQLFSGAVEFLWNAVQLMLWGKMLKGLATFVGAFRSQIGTFWTSVKSVFTSSVNSIKTFFTNGFNAMKSVATANMSTIASTIRSVMNSIRSFISTVWNGIKSLITSALSGIVSGVRTGFNTIRTVISTVMNAAKAVISAIWNAIKALFRSSLSSMLSAVRAGFSNMVSAIRTAMGNVLTAIRTSMGNALSSIKTIVSNMVSAVKAKASAFLSAGMDLIRGLINGIKNMSASAVSAVAGVVDGVVSKAKSLLKIKSPSRVFMEIGGFVGTGMAIGITKTEAANAKAFTGVNKVLTSIAKTNANEIAKISNDAGKKVAQVRKDNAAKERKIETEAASAIQKIVAKAHAKKRKLSTDEANKIYDIRKNAAAKIKTLEAGNAKEVSAIYSKAVAERAKKESELSKLRLDAVKQFISDKKSLDDITLVAEANVWRRTQELFKKGSKERIEAQKNYRDTLQSIEAEMTKAREDFASKQRDINSKLIADEDSLTKAYADAVKSRADAIKGFAGLFDEIKQPDEAVSGKQLLGNLTDQVQAMQRWQSEIRTLELKGVDKNLLEELRQMGPKAIHELQALNSMTGAELTAYSNLFKQKTAIARKEAEYELQGMKADTAKQIDQLRKTANLELGKLKNDFLKTIESVTQGTSTKFKTLTQIGKDAISGLQKGMTEMSPALMATAKKLADSVSKEIAKALKIKSPSRVMMALGGHVVGGLVYGIDGKARTLVASVSQLAGSITDTFNPQLSLSQTDYAGQLNGMTGKLKHQVSSQVSSELTVNRQPAEIILNLGGRNYKTFIDDITNGQTQRVNLVEQYGGV